MVIQQRLLSHQWRIWGVIAIIVIARSGGAGQSASPCLKKGVEYPPAAEWAGARQQSLVLPPPQPLQQAVCRIRFETAKAAGMAVAQLCRGSGTDARLCRAGNAAVLAD